MGGSTSKTALLSPVKNPARYRRRDAVMAPLLFQVAFLLLVSGRGNAGCYKKQLCCPGRNTSCIAMDDGISHIPESYLTGPDQDFIKLRNQLSHARKHDEKLHDSPIPEIVQTENHERLGHMVRPDVVELDEKGVKILEEKYGIRPDSFSPLELTTLHPKNIKMAKHLIFGFEENTEEFPREVIIMRSAPRHVIVRYSVLQKHIPVTISENVEEENQAQLMFLEAPEIECYCDEECLKLGDCCSDYTYACPPGDCRVSSWSPWLPCMPDKGICGVGIQRRERSILRERYRGGAECPPLLEMKTCWVPCKADGDITTVALLLDYKYNATRNHKLTRYLFMSKLQHRPEPQYYCTEYELGWVNKNCIKKHTKVLRRGTRICGECQPSAQYHRNTNRCASDLDDGQTGFWKLIGPKSCNGIWTKIRTVQNCTCGHDIPTLNPFLFV